MTAVYEKRTRDDAFAAVAIWGRARGLRAGAQKTQKNAKGVPYRAFAGRISTFSLPGKTFPVKHFRRGVTFGEYGNNNNKIEYKFLG